MWFDKKGPIGPDFKKGPIGPEKGPIGPEKGPLEKGTDWKGISSSWKEHGWSQLP